MDYNFVGFVWIIILGVYFKLSIDIDNELKE